MEVGSVDKLEFATGVADSTRVVNWLKLLRTQLSVPPLSIYSESNFPSSTGLASSASGFAALMAAVNGLCEFDLSLEEQCEWARRGSASAARSIHGGYVALSTENHEVKAWQVLPADDWDLRIVVAIASSEPKKISSTEGMKRSKETSPFYKTWLQQSERNFCTAVDAISTRDFSKLSQVAESSCRQMHALMLTSEPALRYWNDVTIRCISAVEKMRADGLAVFYTIDAGAQVKVICIPEHVNQASEELSKVYGVIGLLVSSVGHEVQVNYE